jgi:hypothetical protein
MTKLEEFFAFKEKEKEYKEKELVNEPVTVRLTKGQFSAVNQLATAYQISRTEVVRALVDASLSEAMQILGKKT